MAEDGVLDLDSQMPCRKAPRLRHVTLFHNSTGEDTERCIVVGHRLRRDAAEQSGVLSGLSDADGMASLPNKLTPEDVQLWQLANILPTAPTTDDLVTILTVRSSDPAWPGLPYCYLSLDSCRHFICECHLWIFFRDGGASLRFLARGPAPGGAAVRRDM